MLLLQGHPLADCALAAEEQVVELVAGNRNQAAREKLVSALDARAPITPRRSWRGYGGWAAGGG